MDDAGIGAVFEQVSGERVAEGVAGDAFVNAGAEGGLAAGELEGTGGERALRSPGGEEEGSGASGAPVAAKDVEEARSEHGVAVFGALAVLDADEHALGVDVGDEETDGFADAVAGHQSGAALEGGDLVEESKDFLLGENDGEFVSAATAGEVLGGPRHWESSQEENWRAETWALMVSGESLRQLMR